MGMMKQERVVWNDARGTWNLLWKEDDGHYRGKKLGTKKELPDQAAAERKASRVKRQLTCQVPTVAELVEGYRKDRMPTRPDTRATKESWLKNYILPRWGSEPITALEAYETECWLKSLPVGGQSQRTMKSIVSCLWDYALLRRVVPDRPNPMLLVKLPGSTKRQKEIVELTADEFLEFYRRLRVPFNFMALIQACSGLRISEARGLKWKDCNWLEELLRVERGVVGNHEDDVKTEESEKDVDFGPELQGEFKVWKQQTIYGGSEDWIFASYRKPSQPWSYATIWTEYKKAAEAMGKDRMGTHSFRHGHRSLLIKLKTPQEVTRQAMRHEDNQVDREYGRVAPEAVREAQRSVARRLISGDIGAAK